MMWRRLLLLTLLCCASLGAARAQAPLLLLHSGQQQLNQLALLPHLAIWVDPQAQLGLAEVLSQDFRPMQPAQRHPGYSRAAFWLRLQLHNPNSAEVTRHLLLKPPRLEEVTLYSQEADGSWRTRHAGTHLPFSVRELPLRESAFSLTLAPGQTQTLLLRVASRSSVALDLSLWEPRALREYQPGALWLDGLIIGISLILMLLALMMSVVLREPATAYIAAHLIFAVLYESSMRGTSFMLLWPEATDWATRSLATLGGLAVLCDWLAIKHLLRLPRKQPRLHLGLCLLALLSLLSLGLCLLGDYRLGTVANSLLNCLMLLGLVLACVQAARDRHSLAWVWLAALATQALGMAPRYLNLMGFAPHSLFTDYVPPVLMELGCLLVLVGLLRRFYLQHQRYERGLEVAVSERTAELALATGHAQASDAAKGRLLGYIGHDLRAPLASVVHVARELRMDGEFESGRRAIERSSLLLLDMIDELQRFAHQPAASAAPEILPAPVYLHGLLHEITQQAQTLARSSASRVALQLGAELPTVVELDAKRLRQALFNLLSNAAKFCPGGHIELRAQAEGGRLHFAVQDNGPGIAAQDLTLLFEPFVRAAGSAHLPGMGLGLSIARQTVRAMGGDIRVDSQPGQGSLFWFEIPLQIGAAQQVLWPALQHQAEPPPGEGSTALVLDPCAGSREALSERLNLAGYDCLLAADLAQALGIATPLDLLIVEPLGLPGATLEALAPLRARHPRMRVLCCSAQAPPHPEAFWLCKPAPEPDWWEALALCGRTGR